MNWKWVGKRAKMVNQRGMANWLQSVEEEEFCWLEEYPMARIYGERN
jgi:hypothetical protein